MSRTIRTEIQWSEWAGMRTFNAPQVSPVCRQDWNRPQETCFYTLVCAFKVFNEQCFEYISWYRLISNYLVFVPVKYNDNISRENGRYIVGGIIKWYFEKQFGHVLKFKYKFTFWPRHSTPGMYWKRNEKIRLCKDLYANVQRSIHHNSQTTQMSRN